jgi:hypothetical protein
LQASALRVDVFLGVTLCGLLGRHWRFERTGCVLLHGSVLRLDDKNLNGSFIPNFNTYVMNYNVSTSRRERDLKNDVFVL